MKRRCLTPPATLAAILASVLAAPAPSAHAAVLLSGATDGSPVYHLVNTDPAGSTPTSGFLAYVKPPGVLDLNQSPLTILPGSSGFSLYGDDGDSLYKVAVGDGHVPAGQPNAGDPYQLLAVDFGPDGFAPGGQLNFSLALNDPAATAPELILLPNSSGIDPDPDPDGEGDGDGTGTPPPTTGNGGGTDTPPTQIPEPMSMLVWSVLAGLGLARARGLRRPASTR